MRQPAIPCRLDKFLHLSTTLCRRQIQGALRQGRVRVSALGGAPEIVSESHRFIFPEEDVVWLDAVAVSPRAAACYVVLHKPLGVVSVVREPSGKPGLDPWLAGLPEGVFAVGRLDRDTSGLLLLTDDGDLSFALMSPLHHVPRHYEVEVDALLNPGDARLRALCEPLSLRDGPACALSVGLLAVDSDARRSVLEVVLTEGRKRQVRRMVAAAGLALLSLKRTRLGPIALGDLSPGALRPLDAPERNALWDAAGGPQIPHQGALRALYAHARDHRAANTPLLRLEAWLARSPTA